MTCEFQIVLAGTRLGTFWNSTLSPSAPGEDISLPVPVQIADPNTATLPASSCHLPFPGSKSSLAGEALTCHPFRASTCTSKAPPLPRGPTISCNVGADMSGGETFKYARTRTLANNIKCHFKKWVK